MSGAFCVELLTGGVVSRGQTLPCFRASTANALHLVLIQLLKRIADLWGERGGLNALPARRNKSQCLCTSHRSGGRCVPGRLDFCTSTTWHTSCFQLSPRSNCDKNGQGCFQGGETDLCAFTLGTGPSSLRSSVLLCTDDRV